MTEAEWLACDVPAAMLEFLKDKASDRKLQLFASACERRIPARAAVRWEQLRRGNLLEESREGSSNERKELVRARLDAEKAVAIVVCSINRKADRQKAEAEEREAQCTLLQDIFGNPFHPIKFSPDWRTSTITTLAQQMYDARDFSAMPILADALQDAGCDNEDVLSHCRDTIQVHTRGCWVSISCSGNSNSGNASRTTVCYPVGR